MTDDLIGPATGVARLKQVFWWRRLPLTAQLAAIGMLVALAWFLTAGFRSTRTHDICSSAEGSPGFKAKARPRAASAARASPRQRRNCPSNVYTFTSSACVASQRERCASASGRRSLQASACPLPITASR